MKTPWYAEHGALYSPQKSTARLQSLRSSRFILFCDRFCPMRNVFVIHVYTLLETSIAKSPLLDVHQVLLS